MAQAMNDIYRSDLWFRDVDKVIHTIPELAALSGKSILITGASGLICSAIVDVLVRYNESHNNGKNIHIIAAGRNPGKIRERFGNFHDHDYFTCMNYDAAKDFDIDFNADYVIHGASNSYPNAFMREPVQTMTSNILGIKAMLDNARTHGTKRVVYISSSEVYGQRMSDNFSPFSENEYGHVDILNVRSCYPMSKRAAETLCVCYWEEYGIDSVIVRPGHVYGPTASEHDNRIASEFAHKAAKGEDIIMKSEGLQLRSWCYCLDCAGAIVTTMFRGMSAQAYNIAGEILTIREISELIAKSGGVKFLREGFTDDERRKFNPMNNSSLDGTKIDALGWKNLFDAKTGIAHTVEILRNSMK